MDVGLDVIERIRDYDGAKQLTDKKRFLEAGNYSKWSASKRSIIRHVEEYERKMSQLYIPEREAVERGTFIEEMTNVHGEAIREMQQMRSYLKDKVDRHSGWSKREGDISDICIKEARKIKLQIDMANQLLGNCLYYYNHTDNVLYDPDAPYGKKYSDMLREVNIFHETRNTEKNFLSRGQMNSVYTVADSTRGNAQRVLKAGSKDVTVLEDSDELLNGAVERDKNNANKTVIGRLYKKDQDEIKGKFRMNTAHRDVAVSVIDKLFHLNAAVDTSMARTADGNQASLMDKADGQNMEKMIAYMGDSNRKKAELIKKLQMNAYLIKNGQENNMSEEDIRAKENAERKTLVNIDSEKFIESTYNMAALDIIVGHVDRHGGNVMITENGVKAIDNDTAFGTGAALGVLGKGMEQQMTADEVAAGRFEDRVEVRNKEQAFLYLDKAFPVVTVQFRQKILSVNEKSVKDALSGLIGEAEIDACVARVKCLQDYLRQMPAEKIKNEFSEVDREKYAKDISYVNNKRQYSNIMSQVYGDTSGDQLETENIEETSQDNYVVGALQSHIRRMYIKKGGKGVLKPEVINASVKSLIKILQQDEEYVDMLINYERTKVLDQKYDLAISHIVEQAQNMMIPASTN